MAKRIIRRSRHTAYFAGPAQASGRQILAVLPEKNGQNSFCVPILSGFHKCLWHFPYILRLNFLDLCSAGVDDEAAPAPSKKTELPKEWEKSFALGSSSGGGSSSAKRTSSYGGSASRNDSRNDRNTMVNIVGYSDAGVGAAPARRSSGVSESSYGGSIDYGSIAGEPPSPFLCALH